MPKLSSSSSSSSHHFGSLPCWLLSAVRAAKMKGKASGFLKQVASMFMSMVNAKSAAVKNKTSAVKTRLIIFGLLHNKKVLINAISDKIHKRMGREEEDGTAATEANSTVIVPCNAARGEAPPESTKMLQPDHEETEIKEEEEGDDCYPKLRHSFFDAEELGDDSTGSVIDLVKNSRGENQGEFVLEDEIDHLAEVFIRRFHRQMRLERME